MNEEIYEVITICLNNNDTLYFLKYVQQNTATYYKPNMFIMSTKQSTAYIQHVRDYAMLLAGKCSEDEVNSVINSLVINIATQLDDLIKQLLN